MLNQESDTPLAQTSSPPPVEPSAKAVTKSIAVQHFNRWIARAKQRACPEKPQKQASCSSDAFKASSLPETLHTELSQQDIGQGETFTPEKATVVLLTTERGDMNEVGITDERRNRILTVTSDPYLTSGIFAGDGRAEGIYTRTDDSVRKIRRAGILKLRRLQPERKERAARAEKQRKDRAMERRARQIWGEFFEQEWGGGFEEARAVIMKRLAVVEAAERERRKRGQEDEDDDDDVELPVWGVVRPVGLTQISVSKAQSRIVVEKEEIG